MDEVKKEFKQFRGCFIALGVILLIGIFGGITQLTLPKLGNFAPLAGLGGMLVGILFWIGLARGVRWAKIIAGILLTLIGSAVTAFILFDFATSLIKGKSIIHNSAISASNYGQSAFIILATGIAVIFGGLVLIGWIKLDKK